MCVAFIACNDATLHFPPLLDLPGRSCCLRPKAAGSPTKHWARFRYGIRKAMNPCSICWCIPSTQLNEVVRSMQISMHFPHGKAMSCKGVCYHRLVLAWKYPQLRLSCSPSIGNSKRVRPAPPPAATSRFKWFWRQVELVHGFAAWVWDGCILNSGLLYPCLS